MPRLLKHKQVGAILLTAVCILLAACSTKHNTWLSRGYQRLSSHYNVYFNGVEAYNDGIDKARKATRNDYSHVLPVYEFADRQNASAAQGDMETALKKAHKLVQLHSITVKPARRGGEMTDEERRFRAKGEYNPYVPMGYLLMGKANVVIHEEREALEQFDYLARMHEGEEPTYDAKIWAAIAYTQLGLYNNAIASLKSYDMDGVAPQRLYPDFQAAYANIFIAQGQYAEAIPYMEKAAAYTTDSHCRNRYNYILAQLYRLVGDKQKSAPLFLKLSRQMSDYDMAFAAKLDLATVASTPEELQKAEKTLAKMARDPKNADQLDQVYYAIGNLENGKGHKSEALTAFNKSVEASVSNDNQKGLSYLALADIYQAEPLYIEASTSLDSASTYLLPTNDRKSEADKRANRLRPLANELRTIRDNDSTLALARLDAGQRDKILDQMVKEHNDRLEAEREAREADAANAMSQSDYYQMEQNMRQGSQQQSWYFYNNQLVTAGKATFRSRWGNRPNEDNWRRADKSSANQFPSDADDELEADDVISEEVAQRDPSQEMWTRESLLAGLPLTQQAQADNEAQTAKALLRSAEILYNDIEDYDLCVAQLETYLRRFANSDREYDALTLLHFAQMKQGDTSGQSDTDRRIVNKFPESLMAKSITDPSFMSRRQADHDQREAAYRQTYAAYLAGNYAQAESMATSGLQTPDPDTEQHPQFMLVRAMARAKQGDAAGFRADLTSITRDFAGTPQDSVARLFLAKLDNGLSPVRHTAYDSPLQNAAAMADSAAAPKLVNYVYEPDSVHVILCLIDDGKRNDALFTIADYNFTNYLLTDYDIATPTLHGGTQAVVISSFKNRKEAEVYFYALREQPFWKRLSDAAIPKIYMLSLQNQRLVAIEGINEAFLKFMKDNYGI